MKNRLFLNSKIFMVFDRGYIRAICFHGSFNGSQ
jgi:hypothetical protein